jgi:hypothetical protein
LIQADLPAFLGTDARPTTETVMDNRGVADKTAGVVAVVAALIAGVKLEPGDPREIQSRSPRVRSIIGDSITLARPLVEASKRSNDHSDNVQLSNAMP